MITLHFHLLPQYKYELFHTDIFHMISLHGKISTQQIDLPPKCGFIAQLVEHRTGIAKVMGSNPVEALFSFSGFFFPIGKFTAMITLRFHLLPQYKYELFHIYLT